MYVFFCSLWNKQGDVKRGNFRGAEWLPQHKTMKMFLGHRLHVCIVFFAKRSVQVAFWSPGLRCQTMEIKSRDLLPACFSSTFPQWVVMAGSHGGSCIQLVQN